jgi:hypothetical protein
MNSRRYRSLSRLSLCLLLGLMSVSLGATWKDEPRPLSLTSAPSSLGEIDAPGHHFGFSQANVLAQTTGQLTLLALPSPVLTGGAPCTTTTGQVCTITGQVNGSWTRTGPSPGFPSPNQFTFSATTPNGATIPQAAPGIFVPTVAGTEAHSCTAPGGVGTTVTCTGTTSNDIVANDSFVVRFAGSAGPIDVMREGIVGYTSGGSCPGRPTVNVSSQPDGSGRLAIHVTANGASGVANNAVYALGFNSPTPSTNAVIDIGSQVGLTGDFMVNVAPAQPAITFYARPAQRGAPVTVGFTAVDACGNWPSLAGGGPETMQLLSAAPSADVVAATANPAVIAATTSGGAPSVALPASVAPSAPVLNSAAPVSAPIVPAPAAINVPPAVTAPRVSAPALAPAVSAPALAPAYGEQPLTFPPFAQPQPLLPIAPPAGYPLVAPPAPFMAPASVDAGASAPIEQALPSVAAPVDAPPAVVPSEPAASPDSLNPPAGSAPDDSVVPPAADPAAEAFAPAADDAALVADPAGSDGTDAVQPPFAQ